MENTAPAKPSIRDARMEDADEIAAILGEAFAKDPVMCWTFGHSMSFKPMFHALAKGLYLRRGFGHIAENAAATLWLPAGEENKPPLGAELNIIWSILASGIGALRRGFAVERALTQSHPSADHYYLFAVGVRPSARGKGLGGSLICEGLKKSDADNVQAYLENSNPLNTPLYERLGFRAIEPLPLPEGAPPLLGMLRQPESRET